MVRINDLVEFKKNLYKDEVGAIYRVLEINGDRCVIELFNTNMLIRPQSVAMLDELELVLEQQEQSNDS